MLIDCSCSLYISVDNPSNNINAIFTIHMVPEPLSFFFLDEKNLYFFPTRTVGDLVPLNYTPLSQNSQSVEQGHHAITDKPSGSTFMNSDRRQKVKHL